MTALRALLVSLFILGALTCIAISTGIGDFGAAITLALCAVAVSAWTR